MKLKNIIAGNLLEQDIIKQRGSVIIFLVALIFSYMYLKFQLQTYYSQLDEARNTLSIERARASTINAQRVKLTRESNIIKLLESYNIELKRNYQPPYTID